MICVESRDELAAAADQETASDERENCHGYGGGNTCEKSGRMQIAGRCVQSMMMNQMRES